MYDLVPVHERCPNDNVISIDVNNIKVFGVCKPLGVDAGERAEVDLCSAPHCT